MININLDYQVIKGPNGLSLILDSKEIYPDDPGNGTPQLLRLRIDGTDAYGTLNCAWHENEVDGYRLNDAQINWIDSIICEADKWLEAKYKKFE